MRQNTAMMMAHGMIVHFYPQRSFGCSFFLICLGTKQNQTKQK
jgi:hypothetical protein